MPELLDPRTLTAAAQRRTADSLYWGWSGVPLDARQENRVSTLCYWVTSCPDLQARRECARAMLNVSSSRRFAPIIGPALVTALHDADNTVRDLACMGIRRVRPAPIGAVPAVTDLLRDRDLLIRGSAVLALNAICTDTDELCTTLFGMLSEPDVWVLGHVLQGLIDRRAQLDWRRKRMVTQIAAKNYAPFYSVRYLAAQLLRTA